MYVAQETIQYQNKDSFPIKLVAEIEAIYADIDSNKVANNYELIEKSDNVNNIEKLIQERFNLNIVYDKELAEYMPAAIIPFLSDNLLNDVKKFGFDSNSFINLFKVNGIYSHIKKIEKERDHLFRVIHNKKGTIDFKTARVTGYLSKVKHYLIVNFFFLKEYDLTPAEVASVILHEIGHAFVGLENHHRFNTTNIVMLDILTEIHNNRQDKAEYLFRRYFNKEEIDNAHKDTSINKDFYSQLAKAYVGSISSQFSNSKYDETNYEALADNFVTKFNLGKEIVTGLHKLHLSSGTVLDRTLSNKAGLTVFNIILFAMILGLTGPIGIIVCVYLIVCVVGINDSHMTYDFPKDRYNRIRTSIVQNLKNKKLPKELVLELIEQHDFIHKVIENTLYFQGVLPSISNYIIPSNRESMYFIRLQQTIENGLNNPLFVKSAKLNVTGA